MHDKECNKHAVNISVKGVVIKGDKGDNPVKGVDYWTPDDVNNIKGELKQYVDDDMSGYAKQASDSASDAINAANSAGLSMISAENAKNAAESARINAEAAERNSSVIEARISDLADEAKNAKSDAVTAANAANISKDNAISAKNVALTAKDQAVEAKNETLAAKDSAISAITSKQEEAVSAIDSAKSTGVSAITEKTEEQLARIPEVTQLSRDLGALNERVDNIETVIEETVEPLQKQADTNTREINFLKQISKNKLYYIEEREEEGHAQLPSGAIRGFVDEVRGKTEQESTNGYQLIDYGLYMSTPYTMQGVTATTVFDNQGRLLRFDFSGTSTGRFTRSIVLNKEMPSGTYTLSCGGPIMNKLSTNIGYKYLDETTMRYFDPMGYPTIGAVTITLTKPWLLVNIALDVREAGQNVNGLSLKPMFELGSVAHPYEPFTNGPSPNPEFPQKIESVEEINVRVCGRNLSGIGKDIKGFASGTDDFFRWSLYAHSLMFKTADLPDTIYFNSQSGNRRYVSYWDTDEPKDQSTKAKLIENTDHANAFTVKKEYPYILLQFSYAVEDVGDKWVYTSKDDTYEPYTEQTITIIPPRPLNRIGDYFDKADVENGEWEYNTETISDFTSSQIQKSPSNNARFYIVADLKNGNPKCNKLSNGYMEDYRIWHNSANQIGFQLDNSVPTTINEAREFLNNGCIVIFATANPKQEPISSDDLEFLRNLELREGDNLYITDNHGRDVSYLMADYIDLKKAVE